MSNHIDYAARLEIDYPEKLDRLTTFFRVLWIIPIAVIFALVSGTGEAGKLARRTWPTRQNHNPSEA